jgi:hypothetical protein
MDCRVKPGNDEVSFIISDFVMAGWTRPTIEVSLQNNFVMRGLDPGIQVLGVRQELTARSIWPR